MVIQVERLFEWRKTALYNLISVKLFGCWNGFKSKRNSTAKNETSREPWKLPNDHVTQYLRAWRPTASNFGWMNLLKPSIFSPFHCNFHVLNWMFHLLGSKLNHIHISHFLIGNLIIWYWLTGGIEIGHSLGIFIDYNFREKWFLR